MQTRSSRDGLGRGTGAWGQTKRSRICIWIILIPALRRERERLDDSGCGHCPRRDGTNLRKSTSPTERHLLNRFATTMVLYPTFHPPLRLLLPLFLLVFRLLIQQMQFLQRFPRLHHPKKPQQYPHVPIRVWTTRTPTGAWSSSATSTPQQTRRRSGRCFRLCSKTKKIKTRERQSTTLTSTRVWIV